MKTSSELAAGDPATFLNGSSVYEASGRTRYNFTANSASRGFRLGYVALLKDGTRVYSTEDSVYCKGNKTLTENVSFQVPENVDRMWLVVSPAPSEYYVHKWDDTYSNDDQWPYQVEFDGTNIYGAPNIQEGMVVADVDITYDVYMPESNTYLATTVNLDGAARAALGTAFQMQASEIASKMVAYSSKGPSNGQVMFYALKPTGKLNLGGSTANGYGHWFDASGNVVSHGTTSYVFSEFNPSQLTFSVGQYPSRCKNGTDYTIGQVLRYKDSNGNTSLARFYFNIHITNTRTGVELHSIELEEQPNAIQGVEALNNRPVNVFSVDGRLVKTQAEPATALHGLSRGLYIIDGKKYLVK
jgi:hypothetical protein